MSLTVHSTLRRLAVRTLAAAALLVGGGAVTAPVAAAQNPMTAFSLFRESANYRLTDAGLNKYTAVARNLAAVQRQHPNLEMDGDIEEARSISDIAAALDRQPLVKGAINRGGMTSREFVLFTFSMAAAAMFAEMEQNPQMQAHGMPMQANPRNVAFYRANKARLEALSRQLDFGPPRQKHSH